MSRMCNLLKILLALAVMTVCADAGQAAELAADAFIVGPTPGDGQYTLGDVVLQNPTVSTFNAAWADGLTSSVPGAFDVVASGLTWADVATAGGAIQFQNAASLSSTQSVVRDFNNAATYVDGVYYMSSLMSFDENFSTAAGSSALTGMLNAEEGDSSVPWVIGSQWGFQGNGAGGVDAVFRGRANVYPTFPVEATVAASNLTAGKHLFVVKVESDYTGGSQDRISVWIDPSEVFSETTAGAPNLVVDYANWLDPTEDRRTVNAAILNATDVGADAVVTYDEIRFGESWEDATPSSTVVSLREGVDGYEHVGAEVRSLLDGGNRNLGDDYPEMLVGNQSPGSGIFRGLMAFGTEGIADGSIVTDVELTLTVKRTNLASGVGAIELRQNDPSVDMVESEVTWNRIKSGTAWTEGGGDPLETVLSTVPGPVTGSDGERVTFQATPELLAAVQAAVDGDDLLELVMMSPETELVMGATNFVGFWSDDADNLNYRPLLRIQVTAVPEPATLALMLGLIGGLLAFYRRRGR